MDETERQEHLARARDELETSRRFLRQRVLQREEVDRAVKVELGRVQDWQRMIHILEGKG